MWVTLPYMVANEKNDNLIALWPPYWKLAFTTGAKGTKGTSTMKVILPVIAKDTRGPSKGTGNAMGVTSQSGS